jgi:hypothetical protein
LPVLRFQTTVVSRWLVMPTAAISCAPAQLFQRATDHALGLLPDLQRVVLHPAGLRVDLPVLQLVGADRLAAMVEDHAAGAGGALIDGGDKLVHGRHPFRGGSNHGSVCSIAQSDSAALWINR